MQAISILTSGQINCTWFFLSLKMYVSDANALEKLVWISKWVSWMDFIYFSCIGATHFSVLQTCDSVVMLHNYVGPFFTQFYSILLFKQLTYVFIEWILVYMKDKSTPHTNHHSTKRTSWTHVEFKCSTY